MAFENISLRTVVTDRGCSAPTSPMSSQNFSLLD